MSNDYQEFRGKSLNEILDRIGNLWNCTLNGIDYEIVREGSRGLMGIGARDVVIRARRIEPLDDEASREERESGAPRDEGPKDFSPPQNENRRGGRNQRDRGGRGNDRGNFRRDGNQNRPPRDVNGNVDGNRVPREPREPRELRGEDGTRPQRERQDDQPERKFVRPPVTPLSDEILAKAKASAEKIARYLATEATAEIRPGNIIELVSQNGALLIGRHGQTLDSIQYLVNKIVARGIEMPADTYIVVDTEGYRERREQALFRLALRLASKARQSGRLQSVEPMPAHERRIIHLTLQDEPEVHTESLGDGDLKRVVVVPARQRNGGGGGGGGGGNRDRGGDFRGGRGRGPRRRRGGRNRGPRQPGGPDTQSGGGQGGDSQGGGE